MLGELHQKLDFNGSTRHQGLEHGHDLVADIELARGRKFNDSTVGFKAWTPTIDLKDNIDSIFGYDVYNLAVHFGTMDIDLAKVTVRHGFGIEAR